ncbi:RE1-silencing transcription factor isoform X1 [Alligator mississippiensis]|nr:RE1-silencing transcription factor isoform X1 [Alligator mississippiensis]XP_019353706.1 RE1-silencing transcription factor isoform X1 [Alligator mississippiensis]XP_059578193.1 RE1-silencing transcription factor isoform X1 [Alligator mississippiensis]
MATQVLGQSGGNGLFPGNANIGMALSNDMYDLHDLSKAELAAPQLIMLANVALTGEVNGSCCDYLVGEERQMAELTTVGESNFSDSDGEGMEDAQGMESDPDGPENMELGTLEMPSVETQDPAACSPPETCSLDKDQSLEAPSTPEGTEDKCKNLKSKPFRCKPCQYEAESEEEFVHHIRVHSAKKFIVGENAEKQAQVKESDSCTTEEADFSKGPIRCDRCGYNTNRYDHYLAHLKHHNKAGENERVYKCTICTYTTVSEYHWKKHLRNHFPRKVYTCSQCSYFSDRKNNYIQHIRTHTGERPYQCAMCPYSSSQKTHLTRHMRTHSGEKPFKCDQCSYVASNQHEVTRHARQVHNGPKPLTCPHCDYKTADRSNFKKHVELHVNPRQFLCPVCDYAASKKCNLQYHIKSRHSDCSDITMDVSKVKLRTKKSEAELSESAKDKTEKEQTKGESAEKKNEKAVKVEKKESLSKDKKSTINVCVGQVTTRSRKSAAENKEADVKSEKSAEKSCKTKKTKRKAEVESVSLKQDPANDTQTIAKKKKKVENKSRNSQEAQKGEVTSEAPKKLNSCLKKNRKKKAMKNKHSKKSSKSDQEKIPDEAAPEKPPITEEDGNRKSDSTSDDQQPEQDPVASTLADADSQIPDGKSQIPDGESVQDQVFPPPQPLEENVELEVKDQEAPVAEEENEESVNEKEVENEPDQEQATCPAECPSTSEQNLEKTLDVPNDAVPDLTPPPPLEPEQTCETEPVTNPDSADLTKADLPAEEPAPTLPAPEKCEQGPKEALALSSPDNTAVNESQEIDEDEGIHSHDGSDISDNISEGSDDSGLNGARSVQEETSRKASQEAAEATVAKENYVCIFCDRSFKKEGEYSKHLNRHLVNVYYLEKATKEQE